MPQGGYVHQITSEFSFLDKDITKTTVNQILVYSIIPCEAIRNNLNYQNLLCATNGVRYFCINFTVEKIEAHKMNCSRSYLTLFNLLPLARPLIKLQDLLYLHTEEMQYRVHSESTVLNSMCQANNIEKSLLWHRMPWCSPNLFHLQPDYIPKTWDFNQTTFPKLVSGGVAIQLNSGHEKMAEPDVYCLYAQPQNKKVK